MLKGMEVAKTKIGMSTMTKIVDYYEGGITVRIIDTPRDIYEAKIEESEKAGIVFYALQNKQRFET